MSIKTWTNEFYPVEPSKRMTKLQAIEHSLRKWEGLRDSNLKKHGCVKNGRFIDDGSLGGYLAINGESCALCVKYYDEDKECEKCPLYKSLGNRACDGLENEYSQWYRNGNPLPMIKALRKLHKEVTGA